MNLLKKIWAWLMCYKHIESVKNCNCPVCTKIRHYKEAKDNANIH